MVTAGQWQAVKDTLSRPIGRSLTTSDTLVIQQQVQLFGHTPNRYNKLLLSSILIQQANLIHTLITAITTLI